MSSSLRFPDAEKLKTYLYEHPPLNTEYNQKNGITKPIAELAAERFANLSLNEEGVLITVMLMMRDIQNRTDGFTGKAIPNFEKIKLSSEGWNMLSIKLREALIECANSTKV